LAAEVNYTADGRLTTMPNGYFLSFEFIGYVLLALCARHAWHKGPGHLAGLLAGVLFGVLLELATIAQLQAYEYGRFLVMVGDVPLCIGVGWGVILYSARVMSDAAAMPEWARPVLDALLALNIDLAMDAIAIRLGFWDWGFGFQGEYFGVPYANFWAWFWVVASFSAGLRAFGRLPGAPGRWLAPAGAVVVGVLGVLATNAFIVYAVPPGLRRWVVTFTLLAALILVLAVRPRLGARPVPALALWVPLVLHLYFLIAGLVSGVILQPPFLLVVSVAMLASAAVLHRHALPGARRRPAGSLTGAA